MPRAMPFGKHKGRNFDQIPVDYLNWLLRQKWLQAGIRREIEEYLEDPEAEADDKQWRQPPPPPSNGGSSKLGFTAEEQADLKLILQAGFRALALKCHPDTGGSNGAMQRLNLLAAKLRNSGLME